MIEGGGGDTANNRGNVFWTGEEGEIGDCGIDSNAVYNPPVGSSVSLAYAASKASTNHAAEMSTRTATTQSITATITAPPGMK